MHLESLYLRNFRNYKYLDLGLTPHLNIFVGANAQGKTNLLEAISFLARGRSFRTRNDLEILKWGEKNYTVGGILNSPHGTDKVKIRYLTDEKRKEFSSNGLILPKGEYLGKLVFVLFTPEDLAIVKGSPALRRNYFDEEISKTMPVFEHSLNQYQQVIRQRNFLLKRYREKIINSDEIKTWDEQLASIGAVLIKRRIEAIHRISILARLSHRNLTGLDESLEIVYQSTIPTKKILNTEEIKAEIHLQLEKKVYEEARMGQTLVGPHRDDIIFLINGQNARQFASQGQQRTLVLALKLAELEYIYGETGDYPVLLFDDVFSELDYLRRSKLIEAIDGRIQTFITGTEAEKLGNLKSKGMLFNISHGEVR